MYLAKPSIQTVIQTIQDLSPNPNEVISLLWGEHTSIDFELLVQQLNELGVQFFGGIFPGIIHQNQNYTQGVIIQKYSSSSPPKIITNLENQDLSKMEQGKTALVLVDGLSSDIAVFLSRLYNAWGNVVNYIGGGAGSLSLQQQPCILTNKGLLENAAVICLIDQNIELSVQHGWQRLQGPIIANKTHKNVIYELNWQNAFEVYKAIIDQDSANSIQSDNFFQIAKGYPFGMEVEGAEAIVRDPIAVGEQGELICVGEIDNNAVLDILKGKTQTLIDSAQQAALDIKNLTTGQSTQHIFVVDCISRTLFLQDDFGKELDVIQQSLQQTNTAPKIIGILSLGEISSTGNGPIYFYNKTMVLGAFSES
ncbi:MAG: FIST C-terminal domain-containing protein [Saprospiraceae bacterium]|nr:FIST C-terminal domain-containing protein [Saprospiraceae bacterium]